MKKITTFLVLFLLAFSLQGQKVITYGGKVIRAYDANQPLNIETTCEVWLDGKDASTFNLDGTSVDQWNDKSGNDRHVLNGNADATRPTYDVNTGRVIFTDANSTFLQSAAFGSTLSQPNTVFIVYKIIGALNVFQYVFDGASSGYHGIISASSFFKMYAGILLSSGVATNADNNIHCTEFNGANSNYWINGVLRVTGNAGTRTLGKVTLGCAGNIEIYGDREICEVIIFGDEISDTDRDKITGYLANKWSISATTDFKGYIITQDASFGGLLAPLAKKIILGSVFGITLLILTIAIFLFLVWLQNFTINPERKEKRI